MVYELALIATGFLFWGGGGELVARFGTILSTRGDFAKKSTPLPP